LGQKKGEEGHGSDRYKRERNNLLEGSHEEEESSDEETLDPSNLAVSSNGLTFTICRWLKTPVSHYTVKAILEHYSAKHLRSDIQVSIVGVTGKKWSLSNWLTMQETIKSAFSEISSTSEAGDAIDLLEKEIHQNMARATRDKNSPAILLHFRKLLDGVEVLRFFISHYEAALAVFAKFGTGLPDGSDETLKLLAKVTFIPPACVDLPLIYI
jgi:hypothetical protein